MKAEFYPTKDITEQLIFAKKNNMSINASVNQAVKQLVQH